MPTEVGQTQPFYFPLTTSYWGFGKGPKAGDGGDGGNADPQGGAAPGQPLLGGQHNSAAVRIDQLTKVGRWLGRWLWAVQCCACHVLAAR